MVVILCNINVEIQNRNNNIDHNNIRSEDYFQRNTLIFMKGSYKVQERFTSLAESSEVLQGAGSVTARHGETSLSHGVP